ncbi:hypothetical protein WA1_41400 [Scytonema hofmannii PCC 7110]|uniref:Uncharacterized protein n=1 Tax=Scytonema hofmannii PCC 7110 TaxID=128403 RepID=A0A139WUW4_9CYAN|nr:hypothetical protein [Scytonema hofmannii]KYC36193.1 hypothetical protein WA1_41400 [Scytonema hofmannii PCC 7110]
MIDSSKPAISWWELRAIQALNLEDIEHPDLIVLDKDEQVVLISNIKGFPFDLNKSKTREKAIIELIEYLKAAKTVIPFAMIVDLEKILFFQWNGNDLSEPILCLETNEVLIHYEPEFNKRQIFNLYLKTLTEAWISDFCYHWKMETPPRSQEIAEIGLLERLEGGITQS